MTEPRLRRMSRWPRLRRRHRTTRTASSAGGRRHRDPREGPDGWDLTYEDNGATILVQDVGGLMQHFLQGGQDDLQGALDAFMAHSPKAPNMPVNLLNELLSLGVIEMPRLGDAGRASEAYASGAPDGRRDGPRRLRPRGLRARRLPLRATAATTSAPRTGGWLQLSVDHVVPAQMDLQPATQPEWIDDTTNLVTCCRSCNDFSNRDRIDDPPPATHEAFLVLRDRVFLDRRRRLADRHRAERPATAHSSRPTSSAELGNPREEEAHRGRAAARGDQRRVGAREEHPPRATRARSTCGGRAGRSPPAARSSSRASSTTRRSDPERFPTLEGAGGRADAPLRDHRAPRPVGEQHERGGPRGGPGRDPPLHRRQPAAGPRPVLRRRLDPARGPAPRPHRLRVGPQPGRRPHHEGAHRDPAEVRRTCRRSTPMRAAAWVGTGPGRAPPGWPRTSAATAPGCATRRSAGSATCTRRSASPRSTAAARRRSSPGSGRARSLARTPPAARQCRSSARSRSRRRGARRPGSSRVVDRRAKTVAFACPTGQRRAPGWRRSAGQGARCVVCEHTVRSDALRAEGRAGRMGDQLHGDRRRRADSGRIYLPPTATSTRQSRASADPTGVPDDEPPRPGTRIPLQAYGMTDIADLFTARQLVALTTFSDLVGEARDACVRDASRAGLLGRRRPLAARRPAPRLRRRCRDLPGVRCRPCRGLSTTRCVGGSIGREDRTDTVRPAGDPDDMGLRRGQPSLAESSAASAASIDVWLRAS